MKKQVSHAFGKDCYLLGKDADGVYYWLEQGSWDCGWYWGIGYIETYTNNKRPDLARDIKMHTHFDSLFLGKKTFSRDAFKGFFVEHTLSDKEIWTLMELMETLYLMRKYADSCHIGGSHITTNPCAHLIQSDEDGNRINKLIIPSLLEEVYKLLGKQEGEKHEDNK